MRTQPEDYTVGWVCAIEIERVVAREVLDEEYARDEEPWFDTSRDDNSYTFGRIHEHNVVIASLPHGSYGIASAAIVATHMQSSFPALRIRLMVGIAGGAPSAKHDIRLGDVIVSSPIPKYGGVIQYDFGKATQNHEFEVTSHMAPPPGNLLNAILHLKATHKANGQRIAEKVTRMVEKNPRLTVECGRPGAGRDKLYQTHYIHSGQQECDCQRIHDYESSSSVQNQLLVSRRERNKSEDNPAIHYGLIASANRLMKDAAARDALVQRYDVLCFEMEAAGLMNNFPCLIIRGICDYSDTHKNNEWQGYAAATAAVYAKELLEIIPGGDIESTDFVGKQLSIATPLQSKFNSKILQDAIAQADAAIREYYISTDRLRIERLSGETLPLEQCYINLALRDLSDDKASLSPETHPKLEMKNTEKQMSLDEIFNQKKRSDGTTFEPRRIFIQGRAGIGKTTLCKKIVHEFLQRRLGHDLFDRLLWLPLRSLEHKSVKYEWLEFLQDAFTPSPQTPDWETLVVVLSKQLLQQDFRYRTLFLLDGLDEVSRDWKKDDKIYKFLETVICDMPNIILTSRPQANSLKIGRFDLQLETVGFTRNQIDAYIEHCVVDKHASSRMKELVMNKPILQGLLQIPVQLDAFCCTWYPEGSHKQDNSMTAKQSPQVIKGENLSTMTALYSSISVELCRKDLVRIGRCDQPHALRTNDVLFLLAKELRFLEELAFQGLVNGIVEFHPSDQELIDVHFKQSGSTMPLSYSLTLEQLSFLRTSGVQQHHSKRIYHFLHLTFQEFFAAKYFVRHWQTNTDLVCLNLDPTADSAEKVRSPVNFLQMEKYNPRYNIFWRFVTGLVQIRQDYETMTNKKNKNILDLFDELHNKPRDLIGTAHRRQLLYFLSELLPSKRIEIVDLRASLENLLREETITEYKSLKYTSLGMDFGSSKSILRETEFPESILRFFLQDKTIIPYEFTLEALEDRQFLSVKTLQSVLDLTTDKFAVGVQSQAIGVVLQHSRADLQEMVAQAVQKFCTMLRDPSTSIRREAVRSCRRKNSLPQRVVMALITALEDDDADMRRDATNALRQPAASVHQPGITALIIILEDKWYDAGSIRSSAISTLKEQLNLDHKAMIALTTALKYKGSVMRFYVAYALKEQSSLPQEIITSLITQTCYDRRTMAKLGGNLSSDYEQLHLFSGTTSTPALRPAVNDENILVRSSALCVLGERCFLPQETIASLITQFRDEYLHKRTYFKEFDQTGSSEQLSVLQEAIPALITALNDENIFVRSSATYILKEQSFSSEEVIAALVTAFKNEIKIEHSPVRFYAAEALTKQPSLPREAIEALTTELKDENHFSVRSDVTYILKKQLSLPQETIKALTIALNDECKFVRLYAAQALGIQSSLPQEAAAALITTVVSALKDEDYAVRFSAIQILQRQSALPQGAIATTIADLITTIKNGDERRRSSGIHPFERRHLYKAAFTALITAVKDEDWSMRHDIAEALGGQASVPQEIITVLIAALKDEDKDLRSSAASTLEQLPSLPQEALVALIAAFKDEDSSMRYNAAEVLGGQSSVPQEITTILVAALKDEDGDIRSCAARALSGFPSLPQEVIATLITALKDKDYRVLSSAMEALTTRSPPPQELIAALITLLKDEDFSIRLSAADALKLQTWSSVPEEATASLIEAWIASLKDKEGYIRSAAAEKLSELSPLPYEAVPALITTLNDEYDYARESAVWALERHLSLPEEAVAALISALVAQLKHSEDWGVSDFCGNALIRRSPLPQKAISDLIAMLRHGGGHVQSSVIKVLEKQSSLPQEAISGLITVMKGHYGSEQELILSIIRKQSSLTQEAIVTLITVLGDLNYMAYQAYDVLCCDDLFYSTIKDIDDRAWSHLWSYWCSGNSDKMFSCYELDGSLYLWSEGELRQISNEPERTQELLQVVLGTNAQKSKTQNMIEVDSTARHNGIIQKERADTAAISKSKFRSIFRFKKKDR